MKITIIEKLKRNNETIKTSFFTLDLENEKFIEIYSAKFFLEKIKTMKKELSKKVNDLLKEEDYSLAENLKKYAIFESIVNDYVESIEEEFLIKNEMKLNNFNSIVVNDHKFLLTLTVEELQDLITEVLLKKKNLIVTIEYDINKKEKKIDIKEVEEKKEKENK